MRIAIAEDEQAYLEQLQAYLRRYAEETGVPIQVDAFLNGAQLVEHYQSGWDLLLLDVDMPVMNGFDAARAIRRTDPEVSIIFITNLAQYAIKGYEVNALDYILKPISYFALSMKLDMVVRRLHRNVEESLMVNQDGDLIRVPLSHLYYVEIFSHELNYHTTEGTLVTTTSQTLSALEQRLEGHGFVRCHKGCLINLRYVQTLRGNTILLAGKELPVSRNRRKAVMQAILDFAKGVCL